MSFYHSPASTRLRLRFYACRLNNWCAPDCKPTFPGIWANRDGHRMGADLKVSERRDSIAGRYIIPTGDPLADPVTMGGIDTLNDSHDIASNGSGDFVALWWEAETPPRDLLLRPYDRLGSAQGPPVVVATDGYYGQIVAIVWIVIVSVWLFAHEASNTPAVAGQ